MADTPIVYQCPLCARLPYPDYWLMVGCMLRDLGAADNGDPLVAALLADRPAPRGMARATVRRPTLADVTVYVALALLKMRKNLGDLESVASSATSSVEESQNDRAELRGMVEALQQALQQIELTPGPQGVQGDRGEPGPAGPEGPQGVDGPAGAQGPAGAAGPQGPVGPAGAKGETGPQGPVGATGAVGPQGARGDAGAQGLQGVPGGKGDTGAAGQQGAVGPAGATGPAGVAGPAGPTGLTGAKGDAGAVGPKGDTGTAGAKGETGLTGATGPAGATGPQGPAGVGTLYLDTQLVTVPVLLFVGGTGVVNLTWDEAFPDTTYKIRRKLPASLVGVVTVAESLKTTTGVRLTFTSLLALTVATPMPVTAFKLA